MRGTVRIHCFCTFFFHFQINKIISKKRKKVKTVFKDWRVFANVFCQNRAFILFKSSFFSLNLYFFFRLLKKEDLPRQVFLLILNAKPWR